MKNYRINSYIILLLLIVSTISCDKYLEEAPDDRLELNTVEKAAKVVAESYGNASYIYTDMYTDLAGPTGNPDANGFSQTSGGNVIGVKELQAYTWDDITDVFQETPTFYWDRAYAGIAQSNEVLAVIDNLEGDQKRKNAVKGEALLSRAYHHFMLVNLFGLHYDENASTNLGVPYILEPETEFLPTYKRNTVAEVYDLVEKDLLEGLALISDEFFSGTKKYHFTKKAAQAFASRFYLWKKDYANCKKYSDLAISGNPQTLIKDYSKIDGTFDQEAEIYSNPSDPSNLLVVSQFSFYYQKWRGFHLNDKGIKELFENPLSIDDVRINGNVWDINTDARYLSRIRRYFFSQTLSSSTGSAYYTAVELKGEEVLLNRAEANLFLGDQNAALADINTFVKERYENGTQYTLTDITDIVDFYTPFTANGSADSLSNNDKALLELILHERKKEFWDHGLRWFDIKRHNITITHVLPESEGGEEHTLKENDVRKAIQLPNSAISFGLTPNPR